MKTIDKISQFIEKHHVMHISVIDDCITWSATCWYIFDTEKMRLIFASQSKSKHVKCFMQDNRVSGTISNQTSKWRKIEGIQFKGKVFSVNDKENPDYRRKFIKKFPIATFIKFSLWFIELEYIKYTKNYYFFGQKIIWIR